MPDETPFRFAIPPHEKNARKLVRILVEHGALTSEGLRQKFEETTSLRNASFYNALQYCKKQGWFVGGGYGQPYSLSLNGAWKEPDIASIGESVGVSRDKDELEYLADMRAREIAELQSENERLLDWSNGDGADGANVALASLIKIVGNSGATVRQRLKAASVVLGYKAQDAEATAFVKRFLQAVCQSTDISNVDYRVLAAELLRRVESPRIAPSTIRPDYRDDVPISTEPPVPLAELVRQRRARQDLLCPESIDFKPRQLPIATTGNGSDDKHS